ncbi:hypothetical protein TYRP_021802 [Tyrophagus putrescentiae]|nr:hypothetical protein TYRP_021802 [Tyrophagus putrescentiae]
MIWKIIPTDFPLGSPAHQGPDCRINPKTANPQSAERTELATVALRRGRAVLEPPLPKAHLINCSNSSKPGPRPLTFPLEMWFYLTRKPSPSPPLPI